MEGMEAIVEAPVTDTGGEVIEQNEVSEQVVTEQVDDQQQQVQDDGPAAPKDVEEALKALKETNPKIAKALRESHFSNQQFRAQFENPSAAKAAKIALDTVGGVEGIAGLREQVQASEFLEQAAENGDPSVIEDWAADYPEGFKKVMPHALRQYEKMDAAGFQKALQPHFAGFLDHAGLGSVLESLWEAVGANKAEDAKSLIQRTYKWLENQKASAQQATPTTDPDREKLQRERQEFDQQRDQAFRNDIGQETYKYQQDGIDKALASYLKGRKLTDQGKQRLVKAINAEVRDTLKADQGYQRQVKAFLTKKDAEGTKRYIKGHLDTIIQGVVDSTYKAFYGAPVGRPAGQQQQKTEAQKAQPQGGPVKVAKKPALSEIEKSNGYMEAYIAGKAIMATGPMKGKLVTWR